MESLVLLGLGCSGHLSGRLGKEPVASVILRPAELHVAICEIKECQTGPLNPLYQPLYKLQLLTNRKLYTGLQLLSKSVTLNNLEWHNDHRSALSAVAELLVLALHLQFTALYVRSIIHNDRYCIGRVLFTRLHIRSLAVTKRPCDCFVGQFWPNITGVEDDVLQTL